MKQKMVVQVEMHSDKCRSKAMEIAAVVPGVVKVEILGNNKDQLAVTGDGVDPAKLTLKLRKKLRHAMILTVEQEKEKAKVEVNPTTIFPGYYYPNYPNYPTRVVFDQEPAGCSIM